MLIFLKIVRGGGGIPGHPPLNETLPSRAMASTDEPSGAVISSRQVMSGGCLRSSLGGLLLCMLTWKVYGVVVDRCYTHDSTHIVI